MERRMHLGDAELEIMQAIWAAREPVTSTEIQRRLTGRRGWALSTLMTTLARLADKGFVACDRSSRTNYYSALVGEAAYKAAESRSFLQRMHAGSLRSLAASLAGDERLAPREAEELRRLLDKLGGPEQGAAGLPGAGDRPAGTANTAGLPGQQAGGAPAGPNPTADAAPGPAKRGEADEA